jgi:hypothetical protein
MANTVSKSGQVITAVFDGAADLDLSAFLGSAPSLRLRKLMFYPAAAGNTFIVREGAATGPIIAQIKDTTGGGRDMDFYSGFFCKPYVKGTEVTANSIISFFIE